MISSHFILWGIFAMGLHELGHIFAMKILHAQPSRLRVSLAGLEMTPRREGIFSYGEECFMLAMGPVFSLVFAYVALYLPLISPEEAYVFSGLNLVFGLFNLLPIEPLDGGRLVKLLLLKHLGIVKGEFIARAVSLILSLGLLVLALWQFFFFWGNLTLLYMGLWLVLGRS